MHSTAGAAERVKVWFRQLSLKFLNLTKFIFDIQNFIKVCYEDI